MRFLGIATRSNKARSNGSESVAQSARKLLRSMKKTGELAFFLASQTDRRSAQNLAFF